eukprot:4970665-Prymnesium_polylepis.1
MTVCAAGGSRPSPARHPHTFTAVLKPYPVGYRYRVMILAASSKSRDHLTELHSLASVGELAGE